MQNKLIDELQEFKKVHDILNSTLSSISDTERLRLTYENQYEPLLAVSVREQHCSISVKWHSIITYHELGPKVDDIDPTTLGLLSFRTDNVFMMDKYKIYIPGEDLTFSFKELNDDCELFNHSILLTDEVLFIVQCAMTIKLPEKYQACVVNMEAFDNYIYRKLMEMTYE